MIKNVLDKKLSIFYFNIEFNRHMYIISQKYEESM